MNDRVVGLIAVLVLLGMLGTPGCGLTSKSSSGGSPGGGGGAAPAINVVPSPVNFGIVPVGTIGTQTMKLINTGTANLTVTQITASGAIFSLPEIPLPFALSAGNSYTFTATYKPTATGGQNGSITIASNATDSPMIVGLSGTGVTPKVQLSPSATSLNFSNVAVGTNASQTVILTNTGNVDVTISTVSVSGLGFGASGGSSVTLTPNQTDSITVTFDPKAAGSAAGTLSVSNSGALLQIRLSGVGVNQGVQHSVGLNWSPSTSVVIGYNVYRSTVLGVQYARINTVADSSTSYTDRSVTNGQTYYYVVTSVDSSNVESLYSDPVSVTVPSS